jgi:hypothetical protein
MNTTLENTLIQPAYTTFDRMSLAEAASTTSLSELAQYVPNGWILLWQHHQVFAIQVRNGAYTPPRGMEEDQTQHLVRVRAFDHEREWHVWRSSKGFKGRKRSEIPNGIQTSKVETVDAQMPLRGVIVNQLGDRKESETWVLKTRNYVGYNQAHVAGYVDSRFLEITKVGKETLV